jgi:hypothetical protein
MNLKILKLRSGEEIICQILEENESTVKIFQPMFFNIVQSFDDEGNPCDITTIHDWLINTDDKNVSLPMNHVAFISEPNVHTKKLYEIESVKEFNKNNYKTSIDESEKTNKSNSPLQMNEKDADAFGMFLEDLINQTMNTDHQDTPAKKSSRKKKSKKNYLPPDMTDESEMDRHMIMMQLYIPAESIMNMVTSGLLEPKVLLDMIKEVKKRNRFTGDEKERGDFGTKYTDWNPDPKSDDYN